MEHISTIINFAGKEKSARVEYSYKPTKYGSQLIASIFVNNELIHVFESLPHTSTKNPTKTQAKELISKGIKESKKPQINNRKILFEKSETF
jgi:hypothetical protein